MHTTQKVSNALVGAAGVHFIASELSFRGLIALPTIRNAPGIDLVVVNMKGTWHANVQVKTSQHKVDFWPLGSRYGEFSGSGNFYAFLRYIPKERRFEVFLETADQVIRDADAAQTERRAKGNKEWAPWWPLPHDPSCLKRVQEQWERFGVTTS